jgi:predicted RNase H-like HicB family nuclease
MKKYLVVIEKTETGYSAYSPDLEGCAATGTLARKLSAK